MPDQNQTATDDQSSDAAGHRPAGVITGSGGLRVAIWKNKGEHGDFYSAKLERRYLAADDQWQSTDSLRAEDILRAEKLLSLADDWIERDKQKQRGIREVG